MSSIAPSPSIDADNEIGALYVRYGVLAERRAISIRLSSTTAEMGQVHRQSWEIWSADPSTYPTTIPRAPHTDDEAMFWAKCQRLTPEEKDDQSLTALECALQYLVCAAALAAIRQLYFKDEGRCKQLLSKWTDEVVKQVLEYELKVGVRTEPFEKQARGPRPLHAWCDCRVRLLDAASGEVKQYLVDDIVSSHKAGVTVRLKDLQTDEISDVPQEDFEKMVEVSRLSLGEVVMED